MTTSEIPAITIAIDGYSSTGKSSFAKRIARELDFHYLDSGALYRAVTLYALDKGYISPEGNIDTASLERDLQSLDVHFDEQGRTCIAGRCVENEIRTLRVSGKVSPISTIPQVRDYVNRLLRLCGKNGRIVMDGRDIGTTVFPNAELKIFMTADPMVRASRRAAEMQAKGEKADIDEVLANLKERDYIDSHREVSPLTQAPDAVVLDNSSMTMDDQMEWVLDLIEKRFAKK